MTLTVLKPFPHINRRFSPGEEVTEVDLVGSRLSIDDLKKGRFVVASDTKTAEKATAKLENVIEVDPVLVKENATALEVDQAVLAREIDKPHKR